MHSQTRFNDRNTHRIDLDGLCALLTADAEKRLRQYGRVLVIDPTSDNPTIVAADKDAGEDQIVLPDGVSAITAVAYAEQPGMLRLTATGDLPAEVATRILRGIDVNDLQVGDDGHASYGFFGNQQASQSHFVMPADDDQAKAVRFDSIEGERITRLEFVGIGDKVAIQALTVKGLYGCEASKDDFATEGWNPSWARFNTGTAQVNTFASRATDNGKVEVTVGTDNGAYRFLDGQMEAYTATSGKAITAIAACAGNGSSRVALIGTDADGPWAGFLGRDTKAPVSAIVLGDDARALLGLPGSQAILGPDAAYLGVPGMTARFGASASAQQ